MALLLVGAQSKPVAVYKQARSPARRAQDPEGGEEGREVEENKAEGKRALSLSLTAAFHGPGVNPLNRFLRAPKVEHITASQPASPHRRRASGEQEACHQSASKYEAEAVAAALMIMMMMDRRMVGGGWMVAEGGGGGG